VGKDRYFVVKKFNIESELES